MSCHFSCSSCSASTYTNLCNSCPNTRTLIGSNCYCSEGYYEQQLTQCSSTANDTITNLTIFLYIFAIVCSLLLPFFILLHLHSVKLKKIIDYCQLIGIIAHYRYRFNYITTQSFKIINAYNYNYLEKIWCNEIGQPYVCQTYQNLIGIIILTIIFAILWLISYAWVRFYTTFYNNQNVIYIKDKGTTHLQTSNNNLNPHNNVHKNNNNNNSNNNDNNNNNIPNNKSNNIPNNKNNNNNKSNKQKQIITLSQYWLITYPTLILIYLNNNIIFITLNLTRIINLSIYSYLIALPILFFIIFLLYYQYKIINNKKQVKLIYRIKYYYHYLYDQHYHLNYLDHLYHYRQNKIQFYPHSNLIIVQIVFKIVLACSTIILYQYKPALLGFAICIFWFIWVCYMEYFWIYQRINLIIYGIFIILHIIAMSIFWADSYFPMTLFIFSCVMQAAILCCFIINICTWNTQHEGKMFVKAYEQEEQEIQSNEENTEQNDIQFQPKVIFDQIKVQQNLQKSKINLLKDQITKK